MAGKIDPKVTALLLGMPKGAPSDSGDEGDGEDADVMKSRHEDAGKAFLGAINSKDPVALADAFHELYKLCEEEGESPEEEKSESED